MIRTSPFSLSWSHSSTPPQIAKIMHKPLWRVPFWSIADSFCKFKTHKHGRRNVIQKLEFSRTIATTIVNDFLGYGVESTANSIQKQIVDALGRGERGRASNMLLDLGLGNCLLRAEDFIDILKYCARSPDPLFVMETWRIMEEKKISLNDNCYLLMMQALCKGGYLQEALNLINFMGESHGIYPILPVYNTFLGACSKMQSLVHANQCLDLMERKMVGKNEVTYSELLKLAVWQQNLSAVHEIWKDYIKHYSPSFFSLQRFVWSFARLSDLKSAYKTLRHMVAIAIQGNTCVNVSAKGQLYSTRMDIPIPSTDKRRLQKLYLEENEWTVSLKANDSTSYIQQCPTFDVGNGEVGSAGIIGLGKDKSTAVAKVLRLSFNDVIYACAKTRNCGLAEHLILQMQNLGLQPSSHTYNGFVRAVVSERGFSEGFKVLKIMQQRNLKPLDSTLATLSMGCSKALELDLAEALLDQISNCPYPYPYNAFLAACDAMDQPEHAVRILAKMKQLKLQLDIWTYELLFSLFGNVNAPYEEGNMLSHVDSAKRINAIEMDMARNGVRHSHLSMNNLLKALGAEGMIRELMQYLCVAEDLFSRNNTYLGTPIYNTVLHSLVEAKESHLAIELFKNMKSSGFMPDAATYNIMIDCCSIIKSYNSACALVSMMLRTGFCPHTVTYTALIKILLEHENFYEALNLLDQVSTQEIQLDVLLYNTILQKACDKGRIDVIELIVEQMHRQKVQPDPSTCHYVFTTYVDRGFHNMAMEALQVLSMRIICQEDGTLQEKRAEFEDDFILSEEPETELRILEFFRGFEENIAVALLNLRWCAILGFAISWSPNQSPWARRLLTNYDSRKRIVQ